MSCFKRNKKLNKYNMTERKRECAQYETKPVTNNEQNDDQFSYRPHTNLLQTSYKPHTNLIDTSYSYEPHTNLI